MGDEGRDVSRVPVSGIDWENIEKRMKQYADDMKRWDGIYERWKVQEDDYKREVVINAEAAVEGFIYIRFVKDMAAELGVTIEELLKLASYLPAPMAEDSDEPDEPGPAPPKPQRRKLSFEELDKQAKAGQSGAEVQ